MKHLHFTWIGCILLAIVACAGTTTLNPAAPPAPLSEVPGFLRFPETISEISVSTLSEVGTGSTSGMTTGTDLSVFAFDPIMKTIMIGDNIGGDIQGSALLTAIFYDLVDSILEPLHQMLIPVGPDSTFEDLIIVNSDLVNAKIDFSDFQGRGCSGNTQALPICFRVWLDGERAVFGQFDAFPTDTNAGAGDLAGDPPVGLLGIIPFQVSLSYDFRDPLTKNVDIAIQVVGPSAEIPQILGRVALGQAPFADSLLKTARQTFKNSDIGTGLNQLVARWIDAEDFWSATKDEELGDPKFNYENACAFIPTGIVVERKNCLDLGIDVEGLGFAPLPSASEFEFPPDFPLNPTF